MHPALQPVTLLQPFNEAARPQGPRLHIPPPLERRRRRRCLRVRSRTPQKSQKSTQMTISKQPGSRAKELKGTAGRVEELHQEG